MKDRKFSQGKNMMMIWMSSKWKKDINLRSLYYSQTAQVCNCVINPFMYIEDLTWVLMFYWIYQTSWGKEIKCEACRAFYLFFRNEFNKFNNTIARMLDSIYHMALRFFWNLISVVKNVIILSLCTQRCYVRHNVSRKSTKPLVVYRFYCMALFHSKTRRHMIKLNIPLLSLGRTNFEFKGCVLVIYNYFIKTWKVHSESKLEAETNQTPHSALDVVMHRLPMSYKKSTI